jgi:hypothetical protein
VCFVCWWFATLRAEEVVETPKDASTLVDAVVSVSVTEAVAAERCKALPEEKILAKHNDEEGAHRA